MTKPNRHWVVVQFDKAPVPGIDLMSQKLL